MNSADSPTITIRPAHPGDEAAIIRLAALDSAPVPPTPLVLAEIEGELRVAVSVDGRSVIADPFHRTLELAALVRDHVDRIHRPAPRPELDRSPRALLGRRRLRLT
jgi:hypothetical protein